MNKNANLAIIGAGGHSVVVADWALTANIFKKINRFDDTLKAPFTISDLKTQNREDWQVVFGFGDNAGRLRRAKDFAEDGFSFSNVIHPNAVMGGSVSIGEGTMIAPGVVINACAQIGQHCIINTGASVDHHSHVADGVHLGPGARLAGNVTVEEMTFIGMGAVVTPGVTIGARSTIAAGAVVIGDVPAETTVKGVPAK